MSVSLEKVRYVVRHDVWCNRNSAVNPRKCNCGTAEVLAALPESGLVLSAEEVEWLDQTVEKYVPTHPGHGKRQALAILRGEGDG